MARLNMIDVAIEDYDLPVIKDKKIDDIKLVNGIAVKNVIAAGEHKSKTLISKSNRSKEYWFGYVRIEDVNNNNYFYSTILIGNKYYLLDEPVWDFMNKAGYLPYPKISF